MICPRRSFWRGLAGWQALSLHQEERGLRLLALYASALSTLSSHINEQARWTDGPMRELNQLKKESNNEQR